MWMIDGIVLDVEDGFVDDGVMELDEGMGR